MSKSVVITGAGTGIGRAIFDRLLADGWYVVGLDMNKDLAASAAEAAGARDPRRCERPGTRRP